MKKKLIIFALFLMAVSILSADEIIKEINFIGLKRTKVSTALQILRPVETGQVYREETKEIIIQELRESGIFNPEITVETRLNGNEIILDIYVRDKWTLIPIPILSFSQNGSWKAGALAIESNFLGYYKTLGLGVFIGSEGWSLLNFYSDNLFLDTDLKFSSSIKTGLNDVIDENVSEETIREYKVDEIGLGLGMEHPVSEEFSLGVSWAYDRSAVLEEDSIIPILPDLNSTGLTGMIRWKDFFYDIPYQYGFEASVSYSWNWGFQETPDYPLVLSRLIWNINPVSKHLLSLEARGAWSERTPVQQQFRLGGSTGTLTLPSGRISAEQYLSSAIIYNVPLWRFPGGTLSMKGFYEGGFYQSDMVDRNLYQGPGTGIEIFVNNLAIPAIQMNIAWNLETGRYQFSAGIGTGGGSN